MLSWEFSSVSRSKSLLTLVDVELFCEDRIRYGWCCLWLVLGFWLKLAKLIFIKLYLLKMCWNKIIGKMPELFFCGNYGIPWIFLIVWNFTFHGNRKTLVGTSVYFWEFYLCIENLLLSWKPFMNILFFSTKILLRSLTQPTENNAYNTH